MVKDAFNGDLMENEPSANLTTIWLSSDIIREIRVQAALSDVSTRDYLEELSIKWIVHRRESEGKLDPLFGYKYLRSPSRPKKGIENDGKASGRQYSVNISPNTSSFLRKYASEDRASLSAVFYTVLHYSLGEKENNEIE